MNRISARPGNLAPLGTLLAVLTLTLLSGVKPALADGTVTISGTTIVDFKGWGLFPAQYDRQLPTYADGSPAYGDATWLGTGTTVNATMTAVGDLGFDIARMDMSPTLGKPDGTLDATRMQDLKDHLTILRNLGYTKYQFSNWSPPVHLKLPYQVRYGKYNGQDEYLDPAKTGQYADFMVAVINNLTASGFAAPVALSIQNEPDINPIYDGCVYANTDSQRATYVDAVKQLRSKLNANGYSGVAILAPETSSLTGIQNVIGSPSSSGFSNMLSDAAFSSAVGGFAYHTYATAGNTVDLLAAMSAYPGKDRWMTEISVWSDVYPIVNSSVVLDSGNPQLNWSLQYVRRMGGDIVDFHTNYWYAWRGWHPSSAADGEDLLYGDVNAPSKTKAYYVFQKLWKTVRPGWKVKQTTGTDPDLRTDNTTLINNRDENQWSAPVDIVAFEAGDGSASCLMLANWKGFAKNITNISGLKGTSATLFVTSPSQDMAQTATRAVSGGTLQGGSLTLPAYSITYVIASGGGAANASKINAGGSAVGAFVADTNFSGGNTSSTVATVSVAGVVNPAPASAYRTERYGAFTYTLNGLTAGQSYTVRLHFAELYFGAGNPGGGGVGSRKFNVAINGVSVLSEFDILANAGGPNQALVREFAATANSSGQISVAFTNGSANNAEVTAIEAVPGGTLTVAAPDFSPGAGTYTSAQSVTISSATTVATIRYTTNGTNPTSATGTVYSGPVNVASSLTLKAIAYKSGSADSAVTSAAYTINLPGTTLPLKINAGGGAASPFIADQYFSGGTAAANWTGAIDTSAANAAPAAVYQAERYGACTYTIPGLTAGTTYTVRLHFCENYFTAANQRNFNVAINGASVLSNFDVYLAAGATHKAVVQSFTATANSSGQIVIALTNGSANNALINGVEILAGGGGGGGGTATPVIVSASTTATGYNSDKIANSWDGVIANIGSYNCFCLFTNDSATYNLQAASQVSSMDLANAFSGTNNVKVEVYTGSWQTALPSYALTGTPGAFTRATFPATYTGVTAVRVTALADYFYIDEIKFNK